MECESRALGLDEKQRLGRHLGVCEPWYLSNGIMIGPMIWTNDLDAHDRLERVFESS